MPSKEATGVAPPMSARDPQLVLDLYRKVRRGRARLVGPDGKTETLPPTVYQFLVKVISDLLEGKSVAIIQEDAHLTAAEAARMLGVSRQALVKLLERDEIPCHMVGTHRRIFVRDILAHQAARDAKRRQRAGKMTRASRASPEPRESPSGRPAPYPSSSRRSSTQ